MNVAVALLSALIVLPPLLVWADQRGWVSKGMIPDERERAALRVAAENVPGVKAVHDRLVWIDSVSGIVIPRP